LTSELDGKNGAVSQPESGPPSLTSPDDPIGAGRSGFYLLPTYEERVAVFIEYMVRGNDKSCWVPLTEEEAARDAFQTEQEYYSFSQSTLYPWAMVTVEQKRREVADTKAYARVVEGSIPAMRIYNPAHDPRYQSVRIHRHEFDIKARQMTTRELAQLVNVTPQLEGPDAG